MPLNLPNTKQLLEKEIKKTKRTIKQYDGWINEAKQNYEQYGHQSALDSMNGNIEFQNNFKLILKSLEKELDIISKL